MEFDEAELQSLIDEALLQSNSSHPFVPSNLHLGLGETSLLEVLHQRLSKKIIESELNEVFREVRVDLLSRKVSTTLKDLHTVTKNCNKCSLQSNPELPKWNVSNPDVVVVVDSPSMSSQSVEIMVEAFKKAGLSSEKLCLTYVNRCPVKRKYENQEILNCSPYLHTEIQLLNPKLILCLGGTPSSVLFGTDIKIKDVRGRLVWLGYWPIITTYSPSYVLKSLSLETSNTVPLEHFENDIFQVKNFLTSKKSLPEE